MSPKVLLALLFVVVGVASASPVQRDAQCAVCDQVVGCLEQGTCNGLKDYVVSVIQDENTLKRVRVTSFMTENMPQQCDMTVGRTFRLTLNDGYALLEKPVMTVECDYCNDNSAALRSIRANTDAHFVLSLEPASFGLPSTAFKHLTNVPCVDDPEVDVYFKWKRDPAFYYEIEALNTEDEDVLIMCVFKDFWHCDPGKYLQYQDFIVGKISETIDSMHHGMTIGMTGGDMRSLKQQRLEECKEEEVIRDAKGNILGCLELLEETINGRPSRGNKRN